MSEKGKLNDYQSGLLDLAGSCLEGMLQHLPAWALLAAFSGVLTRGAEHTECPECEKMYRAFVAGIDAMCLEYSNIDCGAKHTNKTNKN